MSFASLLNHRMRVRRISGTDIPIVGDVPSRVSEMVPIEVKERAAEIPATRRVSCMPTVDVLERDMLEVYEGPEAPLNLRVVSRANPGSTRRRGAHHIVLTAEQWIEHVVDIESFTEVPDEYGEPIKTWFTFATRFASIEPLRGDERWNAQQVHAEVTHRVTLPWLDGLSPTMRIQHFGRVLEIDAILDIDEQREVLEMMCIERVQ